MKLLTKAQIKKLPKLYSQENEKDPICLVKFFTPWTFWSWYVIEYCPERNLCFGYVEGFEDELGYFSLDELSEIKCAYADLKIERDRHFEPKRLSEIKK